MFYVLYRKKSSWDAARYPNANYCMRAWRNFVVLIFPFVRVTAVKQEQRNKWRSPISSEMYFRAFAHISTSRITGLNYARIQACQILDTEGKMAEDKSQAK